MIGCMIFIEHQAGKLALVNESENLAGQVENKLGWVEFHIGYMRDYPVRVSAKKIQFPNMEHHWLYSLVYKKSGNIMWTKILFKAWKDQIFIHKRNH